MKICVEDYKEHFLYITKMLNQKQLDFTSSIKLLSFFKVVRYFSIMIHNVFVLLTLLYKLNNSKLKGRKTPHLN